MYTRLPSTYELIEALAPEPPQPTRFLMARRAVWRAFVGALVLFLASSAGGVFYRFKLGLHLPQWLIVMLWAFLSLCALSYLVLLATYAVPVGRAMRSPMRWLSGKMDSDATAEDALLRRLGRIPPPQLRSRQRRVEVELALWETAARTVTLLVTLGPAALIVVGGFVKVPSFSGAGAVLPVYAAAFVLGGGFAVAVQQQCSRPLRRLVHVLAEAAEINEKIAGAPSAG